MAAQESTISGTLIICGAPQPAVRAAREARLGGWPERVVLLEPLGAAKLGAAASLLQAPGLELIPALPGPADGEAELTLYSLPGLRGLRPALPVLQDLFPGLEERETRPIELISGPGLQARLDGLRGPLHLWIDLPGAEHQALEALQAAGLLEQAETVTLRCGSEPFFEGASDCAALRARLEALSFAMAERDDSDPDWPDLVMQQDVAARQRARLEQRLADSEAELTELRNVTGMQATEIETRATRIQEVQAELARSQEAVATHEQMITELRGAIGTHIDEAGRQTEQVDTLTQQCAGQQAELDSYALHVEELQNLVETRDGQLVARDEEISRLSSDLAVAQQQVQKLQQEGTAKAERIAAQASEVERQQGVIQEVRQKLTETAAALEGKTKQLAAAQEQIKELTATATARTQRVQGLEKELEQRTARVQELTTTATARTQRIQDLEKELERRTTKVQDLQKQLGERDARNAKQAAEAARLSAALNEARTEGQVLRAEAKAQDKQLADLRSDRDAASKRLDQAQADQALQMRMQAMHKLDLDDLRARYEKSEAQRRQQEELLRKLTPRLAQAAEQLRHLQLPSGMADMGSLPGMGAATLVQEPPEAEIVPPPAKAKPKAKSKTKTKAKTAKPKTTKSKTSGTSKRKSVKGVSK